jgi:hypothetical protein
MEGTNWSRGKFFNDSTGCLSWNYQSASLHPDRCVCQEGVTPHKHYDEPPHDCARCLECKGYTPVLSEAEVMWLSALERWA